MINILGTLPGINLQSIKDCGRSVALKIYKDQNISDTVWSCLRSIFDNKENNWNARLSNAPMLVALITESRDNIIELLQDKECIKNKIGFSKKETAARTQLAWVVLDEVLLRLTTLGK